MNRNKKVGWISIIASVGILSGCSLSGSSGSTPIDPPKDPTAEGEGGVMAASAEIANPFTATLYARDADGYVAPLSVKLPFDTPDVAKRTLQYMVKGGPGEELMPEGFSALLPEGTEVLSLDIDATTKTATIDFNEAFLGYEAGDERQILEGITWAMTSYPSVEYVRLWVEGKALKEMPVAMTPLDAPLSRHIGINVERASGVDFTRATPVTLYFMNQTADSFTYYVPVTRLIGWTTDVAGATVAELINGPLDSSKLEAVFLPTEGADNTVSLTADNIVVDLDGALAGSGEKLPVEGLQAIVLSLTETTPTKGVQITVDGAAQVIATDDKDYGAQPVSRPKALNPLEL
ncbi:GerMN domain-containing protein [Paenibacillus sp.]|uniref:GerMN domain-containing protein n=1 Tax=Paenibacillus sp. TaxID=58172 RepID=UPI002D5F425A|nr:GerMN domain-containing protein [Paenibacillus sp.]HZG56504.1 GerMN domain-containing protein [Paenibacillus sp.]